MDLKIARQIARLTQRQLADRSGVDESTISLIETDKRDYGVVSYRDIVKIARALGVDLTLLFPVPDDRAIPVARGARKKEERRAAASQ
jgi:transcriptional regulator with XRE-family HTH domain